MVDEKPAAQPEKNPIDNKQEEMDPLTELLNELKLRAL